jgi:hypothetical protein
MIGFAGTSITIKISYYSSQSILTAEVSLHSDVLSTTGCRVKIKFMLRPKVSRPVCLGVKHPSGAYDQIFKSVRQLRVCWCGALSLKRERVRCLQLLLVVASAVIFGSEFRGTRDCVLLSQIRGVSNQEGKVPLLISPRNRVDRLYPQTTLVVPYITSERTTHRKYIEIPVS